VIANMFILLMLLILIIFLNGNYLEFIFKIEIFREDFIFYITIPIVTIKRARAFISNEDKIRVSNNIPD
jgi:hypothetical protein